MDQLLTTRQVQDLLKVDRITIYRMLQDGRINGVKIGLQWRFARTEVERILKGEKSVSAPAAQSAEANFPVHCVQTIQDLFSDVGQVSALVVDGDGQTVTEISHGCSFCRVILSSEKGQAACRASWREFSEKCRQGSRYFTCHAGLQYIGAPIEDPDLDQAVGFFLAGQFSWETPDEREKAERLRRLADMYDLPLKRLQKEAQSVQVIDTKQHARLEAWPVSAARAVQSIMRERFSFMSRLQQIANLTQIS